MARAYAMRKLCPWREEHHETILAYQLDRMMTREPDRVVRLARAYRRRQQLQRRRIQQQEQRRRPQATAANPETTRDTSYTAAADTPPDPANRDSGLQGTTQTVNMQENPPDNNDNEVDLLPSLSPPTSLALRTKRYIRFDEEEVVCPICLVALEEGDRVGVLPCTHNFHVECLKIWLKRKNQCPLCQKQQVANERFERAGSDDGQ